MQKLIRHYAVGLLDDATDLAEAGLELAGQIPASIRESVERAKLGMIGRRATKLVGNDIVIAAKTMKNHLALLNRKKVDPSPAENLATSLRQVLSGASSTASVTKDDNEVRDLAGATLAGVIHLHDEVNTLSNTIKRSAAAAAAAPKKKSNGSNKIDF